MRVKNEPEDGYWVLTLALIKPIMLILICVFALMCFVTSIELNKLSSANFTKFTELTASSVLMIPMLITLIGLYATYHMHKSTMIIFFGLVVLHAIFCVAFVTFALSNNCFTDSMTNTILQMHKSMDRYSIQAFNISQPIEEWNDYEETWAIDNFQKKLACCGIIKDKHEWNDKLLEKYNIAHIYPKSCCKKPFTNSSSIPVTVYCQSDDDLYQESCASQLRTIYPRLLIYMVVLCILQALMILGAQIIGFKVQEPIAEKPRNPAEIAWMQFVNAQYKPDMKSRSKSCV